MKSHVIVLCAVLLSLSSCKEGESTDTSSPNEDLVSASTETDLKEFRLENVPLTQEIGEFPYLTAPEGYTHSGEKKKTLEEKYFFYQDSLVKKVSGEYLHATVFSQGDVFEDTHVVNEYRKMIEKLGGVEIYAGRLPLAARDLIDKEQPAYVSDMYDPSPYKYKQYLIRTSQENIWIELCHGLNSQQLDLTVVREEGANQ